MSVPSDIGMGETVREAWLLDIAAGLQRTLCAAAVDRAEAHALPAALSTLPPPSNRVEELILGGLLLELTLGTRGHPPQDVAARARVLASTFERVPALTIAQRAADEICRQYPLPLRICGLAEMLACDETTLRRQFHYEYGTGMRDYHVRARIQAAIRLIGGHQVKLAAVASAVGYASEKNFYRNVRELTGCTPGQLKERSEQQLAQLADLLLPRRRGDGARALTGS